MLKKDIFNHDVKAQFKASARDRMFRFMMADDMIKGAVVHSTRMINEMRANHELGPLETLVLGQAYIAVALMTSNLKGKGKVSLNIRCSGPVGGLDVEANLFGEVRGFLKNPMFQVPDLRQINALSSLFGAGFLTVTKYIEGAKAPFSGQITLENGSIAEDLAVYYLKSEQIPTGFKLSLHFNEKEEVTGAGGIFLQAMPGVDPDKVAAAEAAISGLDSLGAFFAEGESPEAVVEKTFGDLSPRFLENSRVEFFCRCSQEGMGRYLRGMQAAERADILENGPFPLEITCHHCNSVYRFTRDALTELLG